MYYYSLFCLSDDDPSPGFVFIRTGVPSLDLAVILVTSRYEDNHFQLILNNEFNCRSYAILPKWGVLQQICAKRRPMRRK